MKVLQEILVPQESVNDEYLTVVGLSFSNGDPVKKGEVIIELETSKAAATIEADTDGYITYRCAEGDEVAVNSLIAQITDEKPSGNIPDSTAIPKSSIATTMQGNRQFNTEFSVKALRLIEQNNLTKDEFSAYDFVNEQTVLNYLTPSQNKTPKISSIESKRIPLKVPENAKVSKLTAKKKREIEYLSSVQSGGLVSTIYIDINTAGIFNAINGQLTYFKDSLLPLIVFECSKLLLKYPVLNSFFIDNAVATYTNINVGVAVDIDDGLKVVKLGDTEKLSIGEIENSIFELSNKYLDRKLTTADLTDITFTITDLSANAFIFAPLINKGNAAILGISKIDTVLARSILSLAFDHRVTEGKIAGNFLSELKARLESYSFSDKIDTSGVTCYKCLRNISEDMNEVGFIKVVTNRGEEKLICDMCLFNF